MAGRAERWDRDRFMYERERDRGYPDDRVPPPPRIPDDRSHYDERDDYRPPPRRGRDHSDERYDRGPYDRGHRGAYDDDVVRDRRHFEEDRYGPRRGEPLDREFDRRLFFEKEPAPQREFRESSPVRRPTMVRRQSSLDTFDRRPLRFYEREEYPPPARREDVRPRDPRDDYRAPPYVPIPLPRTRQLGPAPSQRYDEIQIAEPGYYGDEEFRGMPERVKEREVVTSRRRRDRSRESRVSRSTRKSSHRSSSHRSSSRSSSTSSRTSSSKSATTIRSMYPKKGKTRIPARLVSKRALIDLGYPYIEEGNTVIVLKALGQENIDELLKLSEEYKQSELEVAAARSSAAHLVDERHEEIYTIPPPAAALPPPPAPASVAPPPAPPTVVAAPAPAPTVIYETAPPPPPAPAPAPAPVEVVNKTTIIRDVSPARSTTSYTTSTAPTVYERREYSEEVPIGPMAVAERHRSRSRSRKDIRSEIKALEAQLHDRRRHGNRELVRAEQMPDGAVVLFEERVEKVEEPRRGVRIEKDKKGPPPKLVRAMLATLT
ncbi:hypothetical protein CH063_00359 [Colletotrichum higginsianum]|uniref:DUF8035 domain-containing protein n=2 Tax=Colletotrichum higginsianum TaxID=80884 RepID=H1VJW2_COLHI|nr:hypothetical protein CH35J_000921 [Colletotrichum higginsianum]CCF40515.1 hypothetical protein CH063_00359 [Colletotrichum higginsianum]